ncbi:MAG: hypothetical protein WAV67_08785 [Dokdonella sp.]
MIDEQPLLDMSAKVLQVAQCHRLGLLRQHRGGITQRFRCLQFLRHTSPWRGVHVRRIELDSPPDVAGCNSTTIAPSALADRVARSKYSAAGPVGPYCWMPVTKSPTLIASGSCAKTLVPGNVHAIE